MIRKSVRFSLLLYDDFTGKCITQGGHLFKLNGHLVTPIHKPEGFYVFLDANEAVSQVEITGGAYCPCTVQVDAEQLNPMFPVVHVRLIRKPIAGSAGCEYIEGFAKPGVMVYALKSGSSANKLLALNTDAENPSVGFSGYLAQAACETRFMLGNDKNREIFVTGEYLPDKTYRLRTTLRKKHSTGEPVVRAYAGICDENGAYAIPVEIGQKEKIKEVLYNEEGKKWVCLSATGHS